MPVEARRAAGPGRRPVSHCERREAYSWTLVCQGGGEGNAVEEGDGGGHEADVAGAGDVDDVWPELVDGAVDEAEVAEEDGVEVEVLVEGYGKDAAAEFEDGDGVFVVEGGGVSAGAGAEEWEVAAAGVGLELARGVRDSVDLIVGVRKEGYARAGWLPLGVGAHRVALVIPRGDEWRLKNA